MDYYWQVINHLEVISNKKKKKKKKKKQQFFKVSVLLNGCTTWTNKMPGEKARQELHKDVCTLSGTNPGRKSCKTAVVEPYISHLTNQHSKINKTC